MNLFETIAVLQAETDAASSAEPSADATATAPAGMSEMMSQWMSQLIDLSVTYLPRLALALAVLFFGWIAIRYARRLVGRLLHSKAIDPSVSSFLASVVGVILWALLATSVLGMVGVEVMSLLAVFTAGAVAIGLALKGTLQNFAAGVLLLIKRPFNVGDFIECAGVSGTVREIRFFDTMITTADNKTVIIPNNDLSTKVLTNFSAQSTRRMNVVVGIGYEDDIDKAREIIDSLLKADERIHKDPAPQIVVAELADSSVNLGVRAWMDSSDLWSTTCAFNEHVKKEFDRQGINIPYPQMSIHKAS